MMPERSTPDHIRLEDAGATWDAANEFLNSGGSVDSGVLLLAADVDLFEAAAFLAAGGSIEFALRLVEKPAFLYGAGEFFEAGGSVDDAICLIEAGAGLREGAKFLSVGGSVDDGLRLLAADVALYDAADFLKAGGSVDDCLRLRKAGAFIYHAHYFVDAGGSVAQALLLLAEGVCLLGAAELFSAKWSIEEILQLSKDGFDFSESDALKRLASSGYLVPAKMATLSRHPDIEVRNALAASRYATPDILERLAREKKPSSYSSDYPASHVASNRHTPPDLLRTMIGQDVDWDIIRNPAVTSQTLRALVVSFTGAGGLRGREAMAAEVARHRRTPTDALAHLVAEFPSSSDIYLAVASNTNASPETLTKLALEGDTKVKARVASNPSANADVISLLKVSRNIDVLRALRDRTDLAEEVRASVLEKLVKAEVKESQKNDAAKARALEEDQAADSNTPPATLAELAECPSAKVRLLIAARVDTPAESLVALAADESVAMRRALALNSSCPPAARDILAGDTSWDVREALAPGTIYGSELTPMDVQLLIVHKIPELRYKGALRAFELGLLPEDALRAILPAQSTREGALKWIQERAYTTPFDSLRAVLRTLDLAEGYQIVVPDAPRKAPVARSKKGMDSHKAWELASNPEASAEDLAMAATAPSHSYVEYLWEKEWIDRVGQIRAEGVTRQLEGDSVTRYPQILVALHPNTSAETLVSLRKARSMYVRASLAQRPDLDAFPTLAKDKEAIVRRAVAEQAECPVELLNLLSLDSDVTVRSSAALHPHSTDEIRAQAAILGVQEPS